jgi:hypothetical protein
MYAAAAKRWGGGAAGSEPRPAETYRGVAAAQRRMATATVPVSSIFGGATFPSPEAAIAHMREAHNLDLPALLEAWGLDTLGQRPAAAALCVCLRRALAPLLAGPARAAERTTAEPVDAEGWTASGWADAAELRLLRPDVSAGLERSASQWLCDSPWPLRSVAIDRFLCL